MNVCRPGRIAAFVTMAALWGACAQAAPVHQADSTADFSTKQGVNHWYYGYKRPDSQDPTFQNLVQTGQFDDDSWTHRNPTDYWTRINATGQHPNGTNQNQGRKPTEEWAIRRWISPWSGTAHVSGTVGGDDGGGGTIVAWVIVDGVTYFNSSQTDTTATPFAFDVPIGRGSVIDMMLAPYNHYDVNDWTPFAMTITVN